MVAFGEVASLDVSSVSDYNRLPFALAEVVQDCGSANQAYQQYGRIGLSRLFQDTSPEGHRAIHATIKDLKEGLGVVILQGTGVEKIDDQAAQLLSITLGSVYGEPTKTDRKLSQIAWPIKYDPNANMVRTFSQSLGEAAYHTDTQYFEKPEDYFGLFCIESDAPGKGTNHLLHINQIINALHDEQHQQTLRALSQPFPFRVPSAFTESAQDSDIEITWAPIIDKEQGSIRYRKDTIASALAIQGIEVSDEQHAALEDLEHILGELPPLEHHLQPGEAIVIHNHHLLHARTTFDSPDRFLYRVRMKEEA